MVRYCIQHESTGINPSCSITKESSAWNVLWYMKLQEIIFSPFEFESLNVDNCILCSFRENKWVEENLKRTFYLFLPQEPIDRHRSSSWDHQQSAVIILWRFAQPYSYSALAATEVMKYYMLFKKNEWQTMKYMDKLGPPEKESLSINIFQNRGSPSLISICPIKQPPLLLCSGHLWSMSLITFVRRVKRCN